MYEIEGYDDWKLMGPEEKRPVMYDWQGEEIYAGDEYYETPHGKILAAELDEYIGALMTACEEDVDYE